MSCVRSETALQLFSRLGAKHRVRCLENPILSLASDTGVLSGDVIELSGDEGTGKTEFLLNVIVQCLRNNGLIFIDTDSHFSFARFLTILKAQLKVERSPETALKELLSRFYYCRCHSSSQLISTLQELKPLLRKSSDIVCLVIDSVAAFYWQDRLLGDSFVEQEVNQRKLIEILRDLVISYDLVVMATKGNFIERRRDYGRQNHGFMCREWQKFVRYNFVFKKVNSCNFLAEFIGQTRRKSIVFRIENNGIIFNK
eukprot:m.186400 g.186400  ORF g.186400 m.186400 type:complete len:256 (+) comp39347_c1_seq2:44-811(+)